LLRRWGIPEHLNQSRHGGRTVAYCRRKQFPRRARSTCARSVLRRLRPLIRWPPGPLAFRKGNTSAVIFERHLEPRAGLAGESSTYRPAAKFEKDIRIKLAGKRPRASFQTRRRRAARDLKRLTAIQPRARYKQSTSSSGVTAAQPAAPAAKSSSVKCGA